MHVLTEYSKSDNSITRADARVKLAVALVVLVMVLSCRDFVFPVLVALSCLVLSLWLRVPLRGLILRYSEPLFIAGMVLVLKLFFSGKDVLFSARVAGITLSGYKDGLTEGLLIGCRIAGAVSVVSVLGFTTPFNELMAGLSWFRVPRGFVEIMLFAYRSLFVLFEDAMVIYTAQKNRLGYSSLRRSLSSFGALAGSLTLKAFENSQNTTVAMVQRGYDGTMPVQCHRPFRHSEVAVSFLVIIAAGFIWKM